MTERPNDYDGEPRQTEELAPENQNSEQIDQDEQTQAVARDARNRSTSVLGLEDSEKLERSLYAGASQDLVDHMRQMHTSGAIDMTAYAGETNHDDNVDKYGRRAKPDGLRGDGT